MKKNFSRLLSVVLAVLMILTLVPISVNAKTIISSGIFDDYGVFSYEIDSEGTLYLYGNGDMSKIILENYFYDTRDRILSIEATDGITALGTINGEYFTNIKNITLAESVKQLGDFYKLRKLENIYLHEGITSVGIFMECGIRSIHIPSSLTTLNELCFYALRNLEEITIAEKHPSFTVKDGVLYTKDMKTLVLYPAQKTDASFVVPDGVTHLNAYSFAASKNLKNVTLPDSLESIGKNDGASAFVNCGLTKLNIPENVSETGMVTGPYFEGYNVSPENKYLSNDEYGVLFNKDKTKLILFPNNKNISEYTVPDSVTTLGEWSFALNTYLKNVHMPDALKTIESFAFLWCGLLEELILPEGVETVGNNAFTACVNLKTISIPASLKNYDNTSFPTNDCYALEKLIVHNENFDFSENKFGIGYFKIKNGCREAYINAMTVFVINGAKHWSGEDNGDWGWGPEGFKEEDHIERTEEEVAAFSYKVYCYKDSTADAFAKKYSLQTEYLHKHTLEALPSEKPTCTNTGLTEGKICTECGEVTVPQKTIPATGHNYIDNICSECGEAKPINCSHLCHKTGFLGFIWKIINFFGKLFGANPVCECGMAHY